MRSISTFFNALSHTFRSGNTHTALDVLAPAEPVNIAATVAEHLICTDSVPATPQEVAEMFMAVTGQPATAQELMDTEELLLSFGLLHAS
ncbi:hypothetical protein [Corynebacterium epidermidicanis]|uniref:Uncharacterized protein n=1 Tax=Corynebacterium epidermidicanis TaxID=1050174 RepID=A0A0G3GSD4_9CORY|nr:hypothetical protein [Corynebacterium epidermidicanis]AKK02463.1 hypothetical protein CEPID_02915 [Corynebacterium epidermidicanis]